MASCHNLARPELQMPTHCYHWLAIYQHVPCTHVMNCSIYKLLLRSIAGAVHMMLIVVAADADGGSSNRSYLYPNVTLSLLPILLLLLLFLCLPQWRAEWVTDGVGKRAHGRVGEHSHRCQKDTMRRLRVAEDCRVCLQSSGRRVLAGEIIGTAVCQGGQGCVFTACSQRWEGLQIEWWEGAP